MLVGSEMFACLENSVQRYHLQQKCIAFYAVYATLNYLCLCLYARGWPEYWLNGWGV